MYAENSKLGLRNKFRSGETKFRGALQAPLKEMPFRPLNSTPLLEVSRKMRMQIRKIEGNA